MSSAATLLPLGQRRRFSSVVALLREGVPRRRRIEMLPVIPIVGPLWRTPTQEYGNRVIAAPRNFGVVLRRTIRMQQAL